MALASRLALALFLLHLLSVAGVFVALWGLGNWRGFAYDEPAADWLRYHLIESLCLSQLVLVALWAGLGPERASVRLPSCAALFALVWLVYQVGHGIVAWSDHWQWFDTIAMGLSLTVILLAVRYFPAMRLRLTLSDDIDFDDGKVRAPVSAARVLLVLMLVWSVIAATAQYLRLQPNPDFIGELDWSRGGVAPAKQCALFILLSITLLLLTLTRFADRYVMRHWWSSMLLCVVMVCVFIGSFFHERWGQSPHAFRWFNLPVVLSLNLLWLRWAGYRVDSSRPDEVSTWMRLPGLPACHNVALAAVIALVICGWSTGLVSALQLWVHCMVERDRQGSVVALDVMYPNPAVLQRMASMPDLQFVGIEFSPVSRRHLQLISRAKTINTLRLESVEIPEGGLRHIATIPKLRNLDLDHSEIKPEDLAQLQGARLLRLGLASCRLEGRHIDALNQLHIRRLRLDGNSTTNAEFKRLQRYELDELGLSGTRVTDDAAEHLNRFTELRVLALDSCEFSDAGLAKLTNLRQLSKLYLHNTAVTYASFEQLSRYEQLELLCLDGSWTTGQVEELRRTLPKCTIWRNTW